MRRRIKVIVLTTILIPTFYLLTLSMNKYGKKTNSPSFPVESLSIFWGRPRLLNQNSKITIMMQTKGVQEYNASTNRKVLGKGARCSPASSDGCITCLYGYHGNDCGIPPAIINAKPLDMQRKIIQAFPINHEIDLLEIRLLETSTLTDLFVILESNYSAYGESKNLHLLNNNTHLLVKYNIMHIMLNHFPKGGRKNGWIADEYLRSYMSLKMLEKLDQRKWKESDIFVLFDADEIPDNNLLWFLKHYEYGKYPLGIEYKQYIFGAFWLAGTTKTTAVTTLDRLKNTYSGNAYKIRGSHTSVYIRSGWHCSWCQTPTGIRNKLTSAQNGDFPRWGDFPDKLKLDYLYGLVIHGESFNGKRRLRRVRTDALDIPNAMRISPRWTYLWDYQWWISNKNNLCIG